MGQASRPTVTLAEVIQHLVAQALPQCAPALAKRLQRAAVIAQTPYAIHAGPDADTTCVHALTDWATTYLVRGNCCTCPDALRRGLACKHSLAVGLLSRATVERNRRQRALDFGATRYELTADGAALLAEGE